MTAQTLDPTRYDVPYATFTVEKTNVSYNTKSAWKLFRAHFEIDDAELRRYEVVVPGRDGKLDLSDALGGTYFEDRNITMTFRCINYTSERFHLLASTIRNAIDGKKCRIVLSDDPAYYWSGRPQVEASWDGDKSDIVITASVFPYKLSTVTGYEAWKWDPFSFVDGRITKQEDVVLENQTKSVSLPIDPARGKVTLWLNSGDVSAQMVAYGDYTWHKLKSGVNTFPTIRLSDEKRVWLNLRGTGSVGVEYRLGSL